MKQLIIAIFNLIKSMLARPVKPKEQSLHWVKADKPVDEMTPEERKRFATKLADEIFAQNNIPTAMTGEKDSKKSENSSGKSINLTEVLLIALIGIVCFLNSEKAPFIGTNSQATKYVEKACNAKELSERLAFSAKASELNTRWSDFATALSTQAALVAGNEIVKSNYEAGNPIYIQTTTAYNIAYFKVIQICSNHMLKK